MKSFAESLTWGGLLTGAEKTRGFGTMEPLAEIGTDRRKNSMGTLLVDRLSDYTALDLETTGFDLHRDQIVEIAAVRVRDGVPTAEFSSLVHAEHNAAENWNHIPEGLLLDAPEIALVLRDFLAFLGKDVMLGHNIHFFDAPFLSEELRRASAAGNASLPAEIQNPCIDTLLLARNFLPDLPHHRLGDLAAYYGVDMGRQHRALDDARTAMAVYEHLKRETGEVMRCPECRKGFVVLLHAARESGEKYRLWGCSNCSWRREITDQKGSIREMLHEIVQEIL